MGIIELTCPNCGTKFADYECNKRTFCSKVCRMENMHKQRAQKAAARRGEREGQLHRRCTSCGFRKEIGEFRLNKLRGIREAACNTCQRLKVSESQRRTKLLEELQEAEQLAKLRQTTGTVILPVGNAPIGGLA